MRTRRRPTGIGAIRTLERLGKLRSAHEARQTRLRTLGKHAVVSKQQSSTRQAGPCVRVLLGAALEPAPAILITVRILTPMADDRSRPENSLPLSTNRYRGALALRDEAVQTGHHMLSTQTLADLDRQHFPTKHINDRQRTKPGAIGKLIGNEVEFPNVVDARRLLRAGSATPLQRCPAGLPCRGSAPPPACPARPASAPPRSGQLKSARALRQTPEGTVCRKINADFGPRLPTQIKERLRTNQSADDQADHGRTEYLGCDGQWDPPHCAGCGKPSGGSTPKARRAAGSAIPEIASASRPNVQEPSPCLLG